MIKKIQFILEFLICVVPVTALYIFGVSALSLILTMVFYQSYFILVLLMFFVAGFSLISLWITFFSFILRKDLNYPKIWFVGLALTIPVSLFWSLHYTFGGPSTGGTPWALYLIFGAPVLFAIHLILKKNLGSNKEIKLDSLTSLT